MAAMDGSAAARFSASRIETRLNPLRPARLARFQLFAVLGTWMEADIVEATVANARAQGCERVYIVDNGSSDETVETARSAGAILARVFATARYDEELRLQQMNEVVADVSAAEPDEHIWWLFLDADEFPHGPNGLTIDEYLRTLDAKFRIVGARFFDHYPSQQPYYVAGRHPLDFQPLCMELPVPMCDAGHRKHPLQRYDRSAAPIECGPGFHHARCAEALYEPAQPVFLHHFPFREEGTTRGRLELMWAAGEEGATRAVEGRETSHMLARFRSLNAVYDRRWSEVANFLALDPISELLATEPDSSGVELAPWDALVSPAHLGVLRWYAGGTHAPREESPASTPSAPALASVAPAPSHALRDELNLWQQEGLLARFFWRDDDAIAATPELDRLLRLASQLGVRLAIAVIPQQAEHRLVGVLEGANCCVWQHGWSHADYGQGEFGLDRPFQAMIDDILAGQLRMNALFGPLGWQRVFVPPYHRVAVAFKSLIPALGFSGVSTGLPLTLELEHVREAKAELDLLDWVDRSPLSFAAAEAELVRLLSSRRAEGRHYEPIGVLTHHRVFAEDAWQLTEEIVRLVGSHPAATFIRPDSLFSLAAVPSAPRARSAQDVTVVVTSCGRHDLLQRTLDSFLLYNTFPVNEVVVVEDGPLAPRELRRHYHNRQVRWQSAGRHVGRIEAVDRAFGEAATEFVFHCDEGWEFSASGFLEKSFAVLDSNFAVLHVGLRAAPTDLNGQPVTRHVFDADGVPYRVLEHSWDAGASGIWHGFSFDPSLRRLHDHRLLGSLSSLDPTGAMRSFEVKRTASERYLELGLVAAVLADNGGLGYVRHVGAKGGVAPRARAAYGA
jgi:hypothetical protein